MSAAYGDEGRHGHAFVASQRSDEPQRFRAAARHSRRVRRLRIGIPVALLIGVLVLALVTWFNPLRFLTGLPISVGDVIVSGTKVKMENPKLSGYTRDGRHYDFTAGAAAQDLTRPGMVELQNVIGKVDMQDNSSMTLSAAAGLFDTKNELLTLERNIVVTSPTYQAFLEQAVVDTHNGTMKSEKPVSLKMVNGTVDANRIDLTESGNVIRFDQGVIVNMKMQNSSAPPATASAAAAPAEQSGKAP
ncbi:MAG TPA: LPS export ABC transporter periplasmic protein LptC [Xanthobacteraceae bacterium]|nr:LPS export ABC transporter periplasmic protein LptC [Xanthobacteraceae bacterium]